jgi:hypothetical protein
VKPDGGLVLDFDGPLFPANAGEIQRWLALRSLLRAVHESYPEVDNLSLLSSGLPISAAEKRLSIPDRISLQDFFSEVAPS